MLAYGASFSLLELSYYGLEAPPRVVLVVLIGSTFIFFSIDSKEFLTAERFFEEAGAIKTGDSCFFGALGADKKVDSGTPGLI